MKEKNFQAKESSCQMIAKIFYSAPQVFFDIIDPDPEIEPLYHVALESILDLLPYVSVSVQKHIIKGLEYFMHNFENGPIELKQLEIDKIVTQILHEGTDIRIPFLGLLDELDELLKNQEEEES